MKNKFISLNNLKYFWIKIKAWIDENILRIDRDTFLLKQAIGFDRDKVKFIQKTENINDLEEIKDLSEFAGLTEVKTSTCYIPCNVSYLKILRETPIQCYYTKQQYHINGEKINDISIFKVDNTNEIQIEINNNPSKIINGYYYIIKFYSIDPNDDLTFSTGVLNPENFIRFYNDILTDDEIDLITTEIFGEDFGSGSGTNIVGDI